MDVRTVVAAHVPSLPIMVVQFPTIVRVLVAPLTVTVLVAKVVREQVYQRVRLRRTQVLHVPHVV